MAGFWRKCRIAFRCVRFAVWGALLVALAAFGWFNQVGLPAFLKTRLVNALQERGVALEFSRMRLRVLHGFVCDQVQIGGARLPDSPAFAAREVQLRLDFSALFHRRWQLAGLVVRDGTFTLPFAPTNSLALTNLQTELRFAADDTWALDHFSAGFNGVRLLLAGEVAHAPEIRHWKLFAGSGNTDRGELEAALRSFSATLAGIRFEGAPQLNGRLDGDARDVHSFTLRLNATVPAVRTPWFAARELQATAKLTAPAEAPTHAEAAWNFWTNLQPFRLAWLARAAEVHTEKINADAVECDGLWSAPELAVHRFSARLGSGYFLAGARLDVAARTVAFTNAACFDWHLLGGLLPETHRAPLAKITWARPPGLRADGEFTLPPWPAGAADWPTAIEESLRLRGELALTNAVVAGQPLDLLQTRFGCSNRVWRLPDLTVVQGKTRLILGVEASPATKNFSGRVAGTLAVATVKPFLPTNALDRLQFTAPLALEVSAAGNWTNWNQLMAEGGAALTNFSIRGGAVDVARAQFAYSNRVWRVSKLAVAQGKTKLNLAGELDGATKDFSARLAGALDAASVRPFLTTSNALRGFSYLSFGEPVAFALAGTGNVSDGSRLTVTGQVAVANCAIREQTIERLTTDLIYSNLTVEFLHPQLSRAGGAQKFSAEKLTLDLAGQKLFFTGGAGNVEPAVVSRAIGPKTAQAMEPYQFLAIPQARVNGCVPLSRANGELLMDDADLRFDIVGTTPFRWKRFETPAITGTIHWWRNFILLTNAVSECYGGEMRGWGSFNISPEIEGTDFQFFVTGTNADFHAMGQALWSATNQLKGFLSGTVTVTSANSDDWRTWNGYGAMKLREGMLWDVPVFGLVSTVLNTVTPGLGNNRATDAAGKFIMTNGVIFTDTLEIHTALMQLEYVGTVDLEEKVNARVTAQLMRNAPLFGSLVSTMLWPVSKVFECKVTGTLGDPKPSPVYVPKLLLVPLHPLQSVESLFTPSADKPAGAAPK